MTGMAPRRATSLISLEGPHTIMWRNHGVDPGCVVQLAVCMHIGHSLASGLTCKCRYNGDHLNPARMDGRQLSSITLSTLSCVLDSCPS